MAYAESTVRHQIDSLKGVILCKLKIPSIRITVRHHSASLALPNIYTRDGIFNPHLAAIKVDLYDLVIFDHFWPFDWRGNRDEF